jgi:hypothetical protein
MVVPLFCGHVPPQAVEFSFRVDFHIVIRLLTMRRSEWLRAIAGLIVSRFQSRLWRIVFG